MVEKRTITQRLHQLQWHVETTTMILLQPLNFQTWQITFVWINSAGGFKTNSITFKNHIYYGHLYEYVRVNLSIGKLILTGDARYILEPVMKLYNL